MPFIKGQSGNPSGRPKGSKNEAARVRDEVIAVFNDFGGKEGYLQWLRADDKRKEQYYQRVLPLLLPKITELEQVSPYIIQILMGEDGSKQEDNSNTDAKEVYTPSGDGEGIDSSAG